LISGAHEYVILYYIVLINKNSFKVITYSVRRYVHTAYTPSIFALEYFFSRMRRRCSYTQLHVYYVMLSRPTKCQKPLEKKSSIEALKTNYTPRPISKRKAFRI